MAYSDEITKQADNHPSLGGEYFAAREAAERFLSHWQEEHAEQLVEAIMKPVLDAVQERVWDAFRDWLMTDAEYNVQMTMARMVEDSVKALIGGDKWANVKNPTALKQSASVPHDEIRLDALIYRHRISREFNPFSEQARRVAD